MTDNKNSIIKKKALGRGLDALLQSPETDITATDISGNYTAGSIAEISLSQIQTNPFQPREDFDEIEITELAASIRKQGIIQPVTVRKLGYDTYQLISGERRFRASQKAGLEKIPAYIRIANDQQMLEMALVENIQRVNLNPIETAIAYQRLSEECNIAIEEVCKRVGKDRTTVSNYLRLLKLPPEIQLSLRNNELSIGHARAIINIDDQEKQKEMFQSIINQTLSVRQVEEMVKTHKKKTGNKKNGINNNVSSVIENYKKNLSGILKTPVKLNINNKGNGQIVISFKSSEELDRILNLLNK